MNLTLAPLSRANFAPFGDVIEIDGVPPIGINQGYAERFNNLADGTDMGPNGGTNISIFVAKARPQPIKIEIMERHPLASQAFFPLQDEDWLIVVAADPNLPTSYRAFRATGRQGINYHRNIWHHPLLVLRDHSRFLIVDRKPPTQNPGNNLEEIWLKTPLSLHIG